MHPPADLRTLQRTLCPDAAEVVGWYRLTRAAFSTDHLCALGLDHEVQRGIESGRPPRRQLWRTIWVAYSFAYAPANLASPYAWATWGRFNQQNEFTGDLIARRWKEKNKNRKPWGFGRGKSRARKRPLPLLAPSASPLFLPPL